MWNVPSDERLARMPALYATEKTNTKDKLMYLHFFLGESSWYVAEYDGKDTFFGFAILNGDMLNAEWGYCSFQELKDLKIHDMLEVDCELEEHFPPTRAAAIPVIRECCSWMFK